MPDATAITRLINDLRYERVWRRTYSELMEAYNLPFDDVENAHGAAVRKYHTFTRGGQEVYTRSGALGMTKREEFARAFFAALLGNPEVFTGYADEERAARLARAVCTITDNFIDTLNGVYDGNDANNSDTV